MYPRRAVLSDILLDLKVGGLFELKIIIVVIHLWNTSGY